MQKLAAVAILTLALVGCGTHVAPTASVTQQMALEAQKKKAPAPKQGLLSKIVDRKFKAVSETNYAASGCRRIIVTYTNVVKPLFGGTKEEAAELWLDYLNGDHLDNAYLNNGARLENTDATYEIATFITKVANDMPAGKDKDLMMKAAGGMLTYR
ncbi:MAG: hypothetical protein JWM80_2000 [Cyanobacteria bacterium RYN_339]|nr:hypothetical protein [Cyanobacteria bacterium RYN_339]